MRKYSVQRYAYGMWCERQGRPLSGGRAGESADAGRRKLRSERPASSTMYERVQAAANVIVNGKCDGQRSKLYTHRDALSAQTHK